MALRVLHSGLFGGIIDSVLFVVLLGALLVAIYPYQADQAKPNRE